ncbi:hypothetical protein KI387_027540, partial [Taxus chinensis]
MRAMGTLSSDSHSDSESGNFSERSLSFRSESCNSSERLGLWDVASEDSSALGHDNVSNLCDRLGYLCLEYFERVVPNARVPLMEKILPLLILCFLFNQLATEFPELMSFKSIDLSPASWMSVAWTSAGCVDQQQIISLLSSADSWLKQLR